MVSPEFATGRSEALVPTDTGARINIPTGDGETNVWFHTAVSLPAPAWSAYGTLYGGYNLRTNDFSDQIAFGAELGVFVAKLVWLQARFDGLETPTPPEDLRPTGGFIFGEGTEYLRAGGGAAARIFSTPFWGTFDFWVPFGQLRNLYAGPTFMFGLAFDWSPSS
ncbi:MAG: hypothetical protein HC923_11890 [Myxococcales bacterium]|nr:hypothetical protein [Myxococcales bacterium]